VLSLVLFLHVSIEHPNIYIFTLRSLNTFHEVVGGQLLENFIKQVGGKLGAMCQIFFCARVFLDDTVDSAVTISQDSVEYSVNTFLLLFHSNNQSYKRIGQQHKIT
jgi:hypothetical protein